MKTKNFVLKRNSESFLYGGYEVFSKQKELMVSRKSEIVITVLYALIDSVRLEAIA